MKRHPLLLSPERSCLLVIDVQDGLLNEVIDSKRLLFKTSLLIKCCKLLDIPVLLTEHNPDVFSHTNRKLLQLAGSTPIPKMSFSIAQDKNILKAIQKTKPHQLIISGIETHICVCQSSLDLAHIGYQVHVVKDATSSCSNGDREAGMDKIRKSCMLVTTEMALFELAQGAGTDTFRKVLPLIKENRKWTPS